MSWENVGSVDTGDSSTEDKEWISIAMEMAMVYIRRVCNKPPAGDHVDVMWSEHELGSYPSIGVWCEDGEWTAYARECESALGVINRAFDWGKLRKHYEEVRANPLEEEKLYQIED